MMASCPRKDPKLCVSVSVPFFKDLEAAGALESLKETYGDLLLEDPNEPYVHYYITTIIVSCDSSSTNMD